MITVPVEEKKSGFAYYSKKFALVYGAGAAVASQTLKSNLYSFPPGWAIYLGYFCSMVVFISIFLAGPSLLEMIKNMNAMYREMQKMNKNNTPDPPQNPTTP